MAQVIEGTVFCIRYAVGGQIKAPVLVAAQTVSDADAAVLLHASQGEAYAGEEVRILAVTQLDPATL